MKNEDIKIIHHRDGKRHRACEHMVSLMETQHSEIEALLDQIDQDRKDRARRLAVVREKWDILRIAMKDVRMYIDAVEQDMLAILEGREPMPFPERHESVEINTQVDLRPGRRRVVVPPGDQKSGGAASPEGRLQ